MERLAWWTWTRCLMGVVLMAVVVTGAAGVRAGESNDLSLVVSRYREAVLARETPDWSLVRGYLAAEKPDGTWADVDYADETVSVWKTADHLRRTVAMARALVDPKSPLHDDAALADGTLRALDLWATRRFRNPNWWHNDIGVPMMARDAIVLLGDRLTGDRRARALAVMDQYGRAGSGGGANTTWGAELQLEYGALTGDVAKATAGADLLRGELRVNTGKEEGEGIQNDWSFYQHGPRLQAFHYGGSYVTNNARLAWQLHGTPWAYGPERVAILSHYVLDGLEWMCRDRTTVPATLDRSASRKDALGGADLRQTLRHLIETDPANAAGLRTFLARQEGDPNTPPLVGFRSFPRSDFACFHRPAFACFVKTLSDRTLATEVNANHENFKGYLLSAGNLYLVRDGREYFNLMPVWDWDLLPGTTWAKDAGDPVREKFAGSVGDGVSGATAMDVHFANAGGGTLVAKKFWACHGDVLVCLIGDLTATGVHEPAKTALDQCLLRGAVKTGDAAGGGKWVWHAGFGYVSLDATPVELKAGPATGSWRSINQGEPAGEVTENVFLPVMEHGVSPSHVSTGYAVVAGTEADAAAMATRPTWTVAANDARAQCVRFADGTVMAAFYEAGAAGGIAVDRPCMVLANGKGVWVANATHRGGEVRVELGGRVTTVKVGGDGVAVLVRE